LYEFIDNEPKNNLSYSKKSIKLSFEALILQRKEIIFKLMWITRFTFSI
jgi:hypothetical protein